MITLIDYFRSGTSHRVRIGLALKGVAFEHRTVDLRTMAHKGDDFLRINPQGLVPALVAGDGALTQSVAILEWLEEVYPEPALLPKGPFDRAQVRALMQVAACDMHPLGNMRVLQSLKADHQQTEDQAAAFAKRWYVAGFEALEALCGRGPDGAWLWGDAPTLADACCFPQLYAGVQRYAIPIADYSRLARAFATASAHPAFIAADPMNQPDAPPR
jgi:maleylpyruvate isomerase